MSSTFLLPAFPCAAVLDTNTVMALWHFCDPRLPALRAVAESGALRLKTDERCLEELRRVLAYTQFAIAPERQAALLAAYAARCQNVPVAPPPDLPQCRDADDQKFVELAWRAESPLLVTRDKALLRLARHRLLRDRLTILTPERFESVLAA